MADGDLMILCCGESLIDMIPVDLPDGRRAFVPHVGGAILNTAIALGRLGVPAAMLSGVSTDSFGTLLADALQENGVSTSWLIRSDRLTTLAVVQMKDGQARYAFYDENSAGRMILPSDLPVLPDDIRALYFGGISLVAEPGADTYAAFLAEQGGDRLVMLDPNIRTGFITDEQRYRDRLDRMIALSDIVKVSDEDLVWLVPGGRTLADKTNALFARGPRLVIVTEGAKGATAFYRDHAITVPAPATTVVDTVGAGDTFNAGFLAGLQDHGCLSKAALQDLPQDVIRHALGTGARVAAVTVSRAGANPPWPHEVGRQTNA